MDTNMEDVKMPEPMQLSSVPASEPTTIPTLDGWIESLMTCKQLAESDVQRLCEKVRDHARGQFANAQYVLIVSCHRLVRCFRRSPTYNRWYVLPLSPATLRLTFA
jgi:hypothetical protein